MGRWGGREEKEEVGGWVGGWKRRRKRWVGGWVGRRGDERTAVEARHAFVFQDGLGGGDRAGVEGGAGLQAGFDHVCFVGEGRWVGGEI